MGCTVAYTTGTYTAGAVKGALVALIQGTRPESVTVRLPEGGEATIPVERLILTENAAECSVVKKSYEKDDVTHNLEITARVSFRADKDIIIRAGYGIGTVRKKGLPVPPGSPAINPTPRRMIIEAIRELTQRGVDVLISAPKGREIAQKTWNPRLGIEGGISIIGTTGMMKPKSAPAFKDSIVAQLKVLKEEGIKELIITPGNISERAVVELLKDNIQPDRILQAGDFLGFSLTEAVKVTKEIVVAGHPAKLAKPIEGYFQTHYTRSPHAKDMVLRFLRGRIPPSLWDTLSGLPTVEGIIQALKKADRLAPFCELAELIELKIKDYLGRTQAVPVLLFDMERTLIGLSKSAKQWIERRST